MAIHYCSALGELTVAGLSLHGLKELRMSLAGVSRKEQIVLANEPF
jgi:hypothetical protein